MVVIKAILADTGAIISYLSERDEWHSLTYSKFISLPKPFLTCEAVIVEACFLAKTDVGGEQKVLGLVAEGILRIDFTLSAEIGSIMPLMKKYEDVPMSLADACLVRMCELERDSAVFTLDSDFRIYRKNGRYAIPLITPDTV